MLFRSAVDTVTGVFCVHSLELETILWFHSDTLRWLLSSVKDPSVIAELLKVKAHEEWTPEKLANDNKKHSKAVVSVLKKFGQL